ncbi:transcriptional regulator [Micromonospora echinospora]|uniref:Helix-turn-helix domain-containing protein n=1 Tax=Micromonospora echinospora TaxID=1877 RepID=A0A1C4XHK0_MICEC|nr:helix-turn-helix transcriptional regulator [Micromonospora echinospora]OZV82428.1 transcriptional regulator [Micromonospora echinospora]SCF07876.1 Helix-turn-helix domain-containing protein [Micromonospora echinospora]
MPPAVPSPILRRRRLGTELRSLREASGLTGEQVIERIGWASASKLSRLENGRSRPDPRDIHVLLDLYGADDVTRAELTAITREAGDIRAWLKSYGAMTEHQRSYAELEAGCAEIREYNPVLVPGLLQTAAYARVRIVSARLAEEDTDPQSIETEVSARLARQALLQTADAPRYRAVLEEGALGRRAGPAEVIREQLVQLCELAACPNVTIQVLPRDATIGDWYLPPTAFSLYRFPDPADPETLAIEGGFTDVVSHDANALNRYKMVFEWLSTAARSPSDSLTWLVEAAETAAPPTAAYGSPTAPAQRRGISERFTER